MEDHRNHNSNPLENQDQVNQAGSPQSELSIGAPSGAPQGTPVTGRLPVERSCLDCGEAACRSVGGCDDVFVHEVDTDAPPPSIEDQETARREALAKTTPAEGSGFPRLVNNGRNSASCEWSRSQRRSYGRLMSFMSLKKGEGEQLLRLDLTSAEGCGENLRKRWQELRRRIEKTFHLVVDYVMVETTEGNGVLHMVIGVKHTRLENKSPVYIPKPWLIKQWKNITGGSYIVKIQRVGNFNKKYRKKSYKTHFKDISKYVVSQYLADQGTAYKRMSWSWRRGSLAIGREFKHFLGMCRQGIFKVGEGLVYMKKKRWELYEGWTELLSSGWWLPCPERMYYIADGVVRVHLWK